MPATLPVTNPNPKSGDISVNIYGYTPWLGLGVTAVILFAICLVAHIVYAILASQRSKRHQLDDDDKSSGEQIMIESGETTKRSALHTHMPRIAPFDILFSVGCVLEVIGYGFRSASSSDPYTLTSYILNYFMIVIAPVFFSAALYYTLSVILQLNEANATLLPLSGKAIIAIFVTSDVLTIIMQVAGAALVGVSESNLADGTKPPVTPAQANYILLAGLSTQVFFFSIYLALLFLFIVRLRRWTSSGEKNHVNKMNVGRKSGAQLHILAISDEINVGRRPVALLSILVVSSLLVYTRTIFRLAESATGVGSSLSHNQPLFAALETVPIMVTVVLWTVFPLLYLL